MSITREGDDRSKSEELIDEQREKDRKEADKEDRKREKTEKMDKKSGK